MADDDEIVVCCAALTTIACVYLSRCKIQHSCVLPKRYVRERQQYNVLNTLLPELATNDVGSG